MATWNELAIEVLSKEDIRRIEKMKNYAELEDNSVLIREVLWRSWEITDFAKRQGLKDASEEFILDTPLDLLVKLYKDKEMSYQDVMNKLDYPKG